MRRQERKAAMQKRIRRNEERSGDKWALMRQAAQITELEAKSVRLRAENTKLQLLITGTILPYIRGESLYGKPHIEELIANDLTEKE